ACPSPVEQWRIRDDPEDPDRVDPLGFNGAEMLPVVAEVEDIRKLLAELETAQPFAAVVVQRSWVLVLHVGHADAVPVAQEEGVQVAAVPACEAVVDGLCQLLEGV